MGRAELLSRSVILLDLAALVYLSGFVAHWLALLAGRRMPDLCGYWLLRLAFVVHTLGLVLRWTGTGFAHPPLTGYYEVLASFSWFVALVHLYGTHRYRIPVATAALGLPVTLFCGFLLGLAWLAPTKGFESFLPVLQSRWLFVHVGSGMLGYGFLAVSALVSILLLFRGSVAADSLQAGVSVLAVAALGLLERKALLAGDGLALAVVGVFALHLFLAVAETSFRAAPGARPGQRNASRKAQTRTTLNSFLLDSKEAPDGIRVILRLIFGAAAFLVLVMLIRDLRTARPLSEPGVRLGLAGLAVIFGVISAAAAAVGRRTFWRESLPETTVLDRWAYRSALLGFAFLVLCLVSGGFWAHIAWGRFWGWDLKEVWALGVCVYYGIYFHQRVESESSGDSAAERSAVIGAGGLLVVLFAFFGVELLQATLHSFLGTG